MGVSGGAWLASDHVTTPFVPERDSTDSALMLTQPRFKALTSQFSNRSVQARMRSIRDSSVSSPLSGAFGLYYLFVVKTGNACTVASGAQRVTS